MVVRSTVPRTTTLFVRSYRGFDGRHCRFPSPFAAERVKLAIGECAAGRSGSEEACVSLRLVPRVPFGIPPGAGCGVSLALPSLSLDPPRGLTVPHISDEAVSWSPLPNPLPHEKRPQCLARW